MNDFFSRRSSTWAIGIVAVVAVFCVGFFAGRNATSEESKVANVINKDSVDGSVDFAPFWKAWNLINEKYVPTNGTTTDKVSDQTRVYGAIQGMTASLGDPYTVFFPPSEAKNFNEAISGNFEGVGMEVGIRDNVLTVISPLKGTPAFRAGIKTGDKILKINDKVTTGISVEDAINQIKGKKGTSVKFSLLREGTKDPIEISVVRDTIDVPTVDTETKGDVFIIHLYSFSAISPNLFRNALRQFVESGKTKLIVDLRGNPGGYLEAAIDMASWFLPPGDVVVKEDFRNSQDAQVYRSKGYNIFNDTLKLVVMIDGGSASASEILAGALQENGKATLVGTQSFGKGSVQELVDITPDTSLKVTVARWLTPKGNSISHNGITPDVVVKLDEPQFLKGVDTQLQKALEVVNAK
jgi:carboxyl-terminal processing protease